MLEYREHPMMTIAGLGRLVLLEERIPFTFLTPDASGDFFSGSSVLEVRNGMKCTLEVSATDPSSFPVESKGMDS